MLRCCGAGQIICFWMQDHKHSDKLQKEEDGYTTQPLTWDRMLWGVPGHPHWQQTEEQHWGCIQKGDDGEFLSVSCGECSVLHCGLLGSSVWAGDAKRQNKLIRKTGSMTDWKPNTLSCGGEVVTNSYSWWTSLTTLYWTDSSRAPSLRDWWTDTENLWCKSLPTCLFPSVGAHTVPTSHWLWTSQLTNWPTTFRNTGQMLLTIMQPSIRMFTCSYNHTWIRERWQWEE